MILFVVRNFSLNFALFTSVSNIYCLCHIRISAFQQVFVQSFFFRVVSLYIFYTAPLGKNVEINYE